MENWEAWLTNQKTLWNIEFHNLHTSGITTSIDYPRALVIRSQTMEDSSSINSLVEECALADLSDNVEFVTHSSGPFGEFTTQQRLKMIRLSLAEIDSQNSATPVLENMGCIYKFTHACMDPITNAEIEKTQIAVGVIKKIYQLADFDEKVYDIRFCPPKGAKAATSKRPDTLYQNLHPDFHYNLHYKSKKGKKVEQEDKGLPKSVMLAFNLEMNKDGTFSKRRMTDSRYNISSYSLAANVISEFYNTREC